MTFEDYALTAVKYYFLAVASFFPMLNPFGAIPLLLSLTSDMSDAERRQQAVRASWYTAIIMTFCLFLGDALLWFFGISVGALRVAGGLIVAYLGFGMLFPTPKGSAPASQPSGKRDYAFIPLALPTLSGAGTIAMIIGVSTHIAERTSIHEKIAGYVITLAAIATVSLLTAVILKASVRINRSLGAQGMEAMSRIVGLLMICIGVQYVAAGIKLLVETP
ncbi:MAG: MarC family NAAT transporter [Acidobacteriota bacterium]